MTTQPSDWAVELLPCPFCGGRAHLERTGHVACETGWPCAHTAYFNNGTPAEQNAAAIAAWNRRAPVARELDARGGASPLSDIIASMRNFADVADEVTVNNAPAAIRNWADMLDASGGGVEPFAYMPAHIVESVATNRRLGNEAVFDARTRRHDPGDVPLYATPRATEAGTTNSAQISSEVVVGDVGEDTRCRHDNGRPGYDLWHCSDCGAVKTDSGWGIAKHRYFNDRAEAEFFREHGRLPDDGRPQPWGNAAMGAVGAGGGDHG